MMGKAKLGVIALVIITTFLTACVFHKVSAREMIASMHEINSGKRAEINLLWYEGSDSEFDYFGYVYSMTGTKNFKVPVGELTLQRMNLTDDDSKWVRIRDISGVWSASWLYNGKWEADEKGIGIQLGTESK